MSVAFIDKVLQVFGLERNTLEPLSTDTTLDKFAEVVGWKGELSQSVEEICIRCKIELVLEKELLEGGMVSNQWYVFEEHVWGIIAIPGTFFR